MIRGSRFENELVSEIQSAYGEQGVTWLSGCCKCFTSFTVSESS